MQTMAPSSPERGIIWFFSFCRNTFLARYAWRSCSCSITSVTLSFVVLIWMFVFTKERVFFPLKWDLFASYHSQQCQWAGKKCLCLLDLTCWCTLNDVEIIKLNECDRVSGYRAKHLPLKTLIFVTGLQWKCLPLRIAELMDPNHQKFL